MITSLITVARKWCEGYQNRAFITQTITLTLDKFPEVFEVPMPPLISVTSIEYIDPAGVQQTLASSVYDVDTNSEPGRIALAHAQSWPGIRGDINSVEVIYQAGYGVAAAVPETVKQAIRLLIVHYYENRGDEDVAIPSGVISLLSPDRVGMV